MLRNEARVMEGLHSLGIEGVSLHNVLKLNIQPSDSDYAVDIRSPAISVSMVLIEILDLLLGNAFSRAFVLVSQSALKLQWSKKDNKVKISTFKRA